MHKTLRERARIAPPQPLWLRVLALFCAFLIGSASTAQAAHIHGDVLPRSEVHAGLPGTAAQSQGEEHCSLCVAMHAGLPAILQAAPAPVLATSANTFVSVIRSPFSLLEFAAFSRPPPVSYLTHA